MDLGAGRFAPAAQIAKLLDENCEASAPDSGTTVAPAKVDKTRELPSRLSEEG